MALVEASSLALAPTSTGAQAVGTCKDLLSALAVGSCWRALGTLINIHSLKKVNGECGCACASIPRTAGDPKKKGKAGHSEVSF